MSKSDTRVHVVLPPAIARRLVIEKERIDRRVATGVHELPHHVRFQANGQQRSELHGCPLWHVIERLLDEAEDHRTRSNRKRGVR